MDTTHNWLQEIDSHYDDREWLQVNIQQVYEGIRDALFKPHLLQLGVDLLVKIYPFLLTTPHIKSWLSMLFHAMTETMKLGDSDRLMRIWECMGEGQLAVGNARMASSSFASALIRAKEADALHVMMDAYINLFRVQGLRRDERFQDDMVVEAVQLSEQLDDPVLQARLFHGIACAYLARGETMNALGYGQMAYAGWHKLGDDFGMAGTAFSLAIACRGRGLLKQAERYLGLAKDAYLRTNDPVQYALMAYEEGSLCRKAGDFVGAVQWRKLALREFNRLEPPHFQLHHVALAHHALGNAYVELKEFDQGRESLRTALKLWEQLDNKYEQASTWITLGYLEGQKQNNRRARKYLKRARAVCQKVPEMNSRTYLEELIDQSFDELN
jgi:tetratricopeptide (TPR) repeat protein